MESESREIPASAVASTARIMATRWMWLTLIPGTVALLFAFMVIGAETSPRHHHVGSIAGTIFACLVCVGLPGLLAITFLVRARRYAKLAKVAGDDSSLSWHLTGKVLAAAREGIPHPELAFTIAGYLRRSLTTVARARLVQ